MFYVRLNTTETLKEKKKKKEFLSSKRRRCGGESGEWEEQTYESVGERLEECGCGIIREEATKRHRSGGSSDCGEEAGKEAASPWDLLLSLSLSLSLSVSESVRKTTELPWEM